MWFDTLKVNQEITANFEVDPIHEGQFPVMTNSFNALVEDQHLIESFSLIQIQTTKQFPN